MKGILSEEDAKLALESGIDGIIVSNHGARQLDFVPSTIEALPNIVKAVQNKIPIFLDGGIRRGTDVLKALALGAKAVFIGRPVLFGLSHSGSEGVKRILEILKDEFKRAMTLCGCSKLTEINDSLIFKSNSKL